MGDRIINTKPRGSYSNPVFRGDYPDPSVVRIGSDFWATATSTDWAPQFPVLRSKDLVHWTQTGAVFSVPPAWARGKFWAPEISYFNKRVYVYYVAQHADGPLSIGVATGPDPRGPYTDHGPLIGQSSGSIDPTPVCDENGTRYLIWKEDGNAVGLPAIIWIQQLSEDGLRLAGQAYPILRNDAAWEGHVIEAPSVIRRDGWYYLFYSGNACCGLNCKYAVGVARARSLLGPWEKCGANPILKGSGAWKCPGHGSVVDDGYGRTFYVYHAYAKRDSIFVGRQMLLDEVVWNDGWPAIGNGTPSVTAALPLRPKRRFHHLRSRAAGGWQWPQDRPPRVTFGSMLGSGRISITPSDDVNDTLAAVVARAPHFADYRAETVLDVRSLQGGGEAGICAYGDRNNAVGLAYHQGELRVWQRTAGVHRILHRVYVHTYKGLRLRMRARRGYQFTFQYFMNGRWIAIRNAPLRAAHLPPWDRGVRIALTAGYTTRTVQFKQLIVKRELNEPSHLPIITFSTFGNARKRAAS